MTSPGNFTFNSVSGGVVATPEPGMFIPGGGVLLLAGLVGRSREKSSPAPRLS